MHLNKWHGTPQYFLTFPYIRLLIKNSLLNFLFSLCKRFSFLINDGSTCICQWTIILLWIICKFLHICTIFDLFYLFQWSAKNLVYLSLNHFFFNACDVCVDNRFLTVSGIKRVDFNINEFLFSTLLFTGSK